MNDDDLSMAQTDDHSGKALKAYLSKRGEWIKWLSADPENDLCTQLSRMMWNDAVFRMINEALGFAEHPRQVCAIHNRMLIDFALEGYLANQILAVRRLVDERRDVNSLYRLVNDLKKNRCLITRENYVVAWDGVPYDPGPAQNNALEGALERTKAGEETFTRLPPSGPEAWGTSEVRHKQFDWLSRKDSGSRSRSDLIHPDLLRTLKQMVNKTRHEDFTTIANKFLAHAADNDSRNALRRNGVKMTLNLIESAHKDLLSAYHVLSSIVLNGADGSVLPVAQWDQFENLDQPWIPSDAMNQLRGWWREHEQKLDTWRQCALDQVLESGVR